MNILVTGGAGYIGSHTVVELQKNGYHVVIADNLVNSRQEVIERIGKITGEIPDFEQIDITDKQHVYQLFNKYGKFDATIHFAALKAVGESVQQPFKYYSNNINALVNVLEAMKQFGTHALVFSSSCTVYGQPDILPVTECAPIKQSTSPYGHTKQICEDIISNIIAISDIAGVSLRYFNPVGAHDSAMIGEYPIGTPNNLVPCITQSAIGKRPALKVFGNDYNTPDGTAVRDFIHVTDLALSHVIALNRLLNHKNKQQMEVFNIGTGHGYSVLEIIQSFEKVSHKKLNYEIVPRRSGDIEKIWADTSLAQQELQWKAERDIDDMMLTAWKWELSLNHETLLK